METIAIISIIASVGTLLTVFSKTIKKSTCLGCLNCESRTPQPSIIIDSNHNSPHIEHKIINESNV